MVARQNAVPGKDVGYVLAFFPLAALATWTCPETRKQHRFVHDGAGRAIGERCGGPWSAWKSAATLIRAEQARWEGRP